MPLLRASTTTFEEVYATIGGNGTGPLADLCKLMLNFIAIIDEIIPETEIWGLTSHENILILNGNDKQNVIARVSVQAFSKYKIEYGENFQALYPNNQFIEVPVHDRINIQRNFKKILISEKLIPSRRSNGVREK